MANHLNLQLHQDWQTNGYLKIPSFFSGEEVGAWQTWVSEISSWEKTVQTETNKSAK